MAIPYKVHANQQRGTSILFFPDQEGREFYIRGGVCWPMMVEREDGNCDVQGYALLGGLDVHSGVVEVFEEMEFVTIENILTPEQTIQYRGLAPWLNSNWAHFYGDTYYWNQGDALTRKHILEVVRSPWCQPKPHLVRIGWDAEDEARQLIWRYVKIKKISVPKNGKLASAMQLAKMEKDRATPPIHALQCLLAGMERFPWRDRGKRQTEIQWEK